MNDLFMIIDHIM